MTADPVWWAAALAAAAVACLQRPSAVARLRSALPPDRQGPGRAPTSVGALRGTLPAALVPAALGMAVGGPVAAGVLASLGLVAVRTAGARQRGAADALERARAVEACLALAGELRAGRLPAEALTEAATVAAGPLRDALQRAARAAAAGGDVPDALRAARGSAVPEVLRALAACWRVCSDAGAGLAAAVERLVEGLVADADRRRAVAAELAGPRATAGLLAVLPLAGVALAAGLGADPAHVLLETPIGAVCLVLGVGLDLVGLLWTRRLAARVLAA